MMISIEAIAHVAHEAHRALQAEMGDRAPVEPWDALPGWRRDMVIREARLALQGYGPETLQEEWVEDMLARGWVYGKVKDPAAVPPTHPALLPLRELPGWQQRKVILAVAVVKALAGDDGPIPAE
jgi:hypothetical protein